MDFSDDLGLWQRRVAECPEGVARRMAAMAGLDVAMGQTVLDLGCGGGHLVRELALAVGPRGRAVGIDINPEQIAAARELCADLAAAELAVGDACALDFADGTFDGIASVHTLEYVPDCGSALAELRRVLKPGGRASTVSVLWDTWLFHGPEPKLNARMLEAWRAHCPHQTLPVDLPRMLGRAGFGGIAQRPIAVLNARLHENSYAYWVAKLVAGFAIGEGVPEADAALWLDQLAEADREGRFGFVSVPVLTEATAI
jgi:SAM-dependent methyltransferase